jgi:hypothetical protein
MPPERSRSAEYLAGSFGSNYRSLYLIPVRDSPSELAGSPNPSGSMRLGPATLKPEVKTTCAAERQQSKRAKCCC